jgi:2-keto-4-pentenoate hydratase/2-oxohepta-3-ene-1,7-dioic acid hydratase in catechol pathway
MNQVALSEQRPIVPRGCETQTVSGSARWRHEASTFERAARAPSVTRYAPAMRLVSYRDDDQERLGVDLNGRVVPVSDLDGGVPRTMNELLAADGAAMDHLRASLARTLLPPTAGVAIDELELLAPVPRPGKVVAVALNYREHASEGGRDAPPAPVLFAKFSSSIIGHGEDIIWDTTLTDAVDYEAELGVVIGRTARNVTETDALEHVFGYTCINDVSARDLQFADRQFVRSKSLDTFCPMGPALVTADEIADPQALRLRCLVNGEVRQDATTGEMVHGVAALVAFCSRAFTLEPGDVIATGTPSGVGWYREPRILLHDGDEVVIDVEGVGRLVNRCREVPA